MPELSRRELLRRLGVVGAAAAVGPAFLAACGSSSNKSSTPTTKAASTGGSASSSNVGQQLQQILGIPAPSRQATGQGESLSMGAVLALTGNGSYYGKTMTQGTNLATKHIAAAGGPTINVVYKDHKSGDPQAGVQAATELGTSGTQFMLSSYAADLGVMLPQIAQYKMFTMDGGGGTSSFAQNKPYFWGTRAITPNDAIPGLLAYVKHKNPSAKTVGLTGWTVGEPGDSEVKAAILAEVAKAGFQFNGLYLLWPPNTTEFTAIQTQVAAKAPDVLLLGAYGQDPGFFMNQWETANIKSTVYGFEFTPDGVNASKGAYSSNGWTFAYDYFNAPTIQNPWGKLFVQEYRTAYGADPDFYAANYYEDTFGMWDLMRRVLAKGGALTGGATSLGTALETEMSANPTLKTVYDGTPPTTVSTFSCDPTTHTVTKREMGVFEYKGGKVTPLAYYNLNAGNFRLA